MRRGLFGSMLCVVAGVVFGLPGSAAAASPGYTTYVACKATGTALPSHLCEVGEQPSAFFESLEREVEVETCFNEVGSETEFCTEEEKAEEGVLYASVMPIETAGSYEVWWYVEGTAVGSWTFTLAPPPPVQSETPPPSSPATTPPPSTPPVVVPAPTQPTPQCVSAEGRVAKLKKKLRTAKGTKAKSALRRSLRKARTAEERAC